MSEFEAKLTETLSVILDKSHGHKSCDMCCLSIDDDVSAIIDAFVDVLPSEGKDRIFPENEVNPIALLERYRNYQNGWNDYRAELLRKLGRGE